MLFSPIAEVMPITWRITGTWTIPPERQGKQPPYGKNRGSLLISIWPFTAERDGGEVRPGSTPGSWVGPGYRFMTEDGSNGVPIPTIPSRQECRKNNLYQVINKLFTYNGDGCNLLNCPRGICLDRNDTLYIADCNNRRIVIIDGKGQLIGYVHTGHKPSRLAVSDMRLVVACEEGPVIVYKLNWH